MFGHVRGAFTDARADRKGRFELADGGTIFLDEIGELDPSSQVKLLRVLQDRTYEVLGSSVSAHASTCASSRPRIATSAQPVADGTFREDLLYRLNLITVRLPALRERREDIPLLARALPRAGCAHVRRAIRSRSADDAAGLAAAPALAGQHPPARADPRARRARCSGGARLAAADLDALTQLERVGRSARPLCRGPGSMTLDEMETRHDRQLHAPLRRQRHPRRRGARAQPRRALPPAGEVRPGSAEG